MTVVSKQALNFCFHTGLCCVRIAVNRYSELPEAEKEVVSLCRDSERPFITTRDVAERFEITQQAAYERLSRLSDRGIVHRSKVGSRAVVWWLNDAYAPSSESPASC
jgi:hypothetical protein